MKKGFTLIELLVVIALLAMLVVFVVPNVMKLFTDSKDKLSGVQKKQINDAFELYLRDTCIDQINSEMACSFTTSLNDNNEVSVTGEMELSVFATTGYFNETSISDNCEGSISVADNVINLDEIECSF